MKLYLLSTAVALVAACGSDGKNTPDAGHTPDSNKQADASIDGAHENCTATAVDGTYTFDANSTATVLAWQGTVTTDLGGGGPSQIQIELYDSDASLVGPQDLAAGDFANYATCTACVRIFSSTADGMLAKQFFQDGGTINLTVDPFTGHKMVGSVTDLSLVEVTIDPDTYESTPVVGGTCLSLGTLALNADEVPPDWTCTHDKYADGTTCDCMCGAHDPDCDIATAPVAGCTGTQVCGADDTCIDVCNVLSSPPVGCPTGVCGFNSDVQDICYTDPDAVSAVALGATCDAGPFLCGVSNTVALGLCDTFSGDDETCRKACDANTDCLASELCTPIVGAKGLCIAKAANDTCQTATTITLGTAVNGTTGGAISNYDAGLEATTCTTYAQPGGDVAYKITLTAGQTITATLTNVTADFDPSLSFAGPGTAAAVCDAATIDCLVGADTGLSGEGETFSGTATTAGVYYIIVDTFSPTQGGGYTLTVTSP